MRLVPPQDVPVEARERVCRQSRVGTVIASLVMIGFMTGTPIIVLWIVRPAWYISAPVALLCVAFAKLLSNDAVNAFHATNWVLRITHNGLWLNLRSFRHDGYPPGRTALFVAFEQIAHVGRHTTKRVEDNGKRDAHWKEQYLDITLVEPVPDEVRAEIAEERQRRKVSRFLGATVRSTTKHMPVTLPAENVLRIGWLTKRDRVTPSLDATLRELRTYCRLAEPTFNDFSKPKELCEADVDDLILELARNGESIAAVKLLRQHRGIELREAKQFIDELMAKTPLQAT